MIKHICIWLFFWIIAIVLGPVIIRSDAYKIRIQYEVHNLIQVFGETDAAKVVRHADTAFDSMFVKTGFVGWVSEKLAVSDKERQQAHDGLGENGDKMTTFTNNYVSGFFLNLYELVFRIYQVMLWGAYTLPFLIAAMIDGLMYRKAKIRSFQYTSPSVYFGTWHLMIGLVFATLVYFNTPLPTPVIMFPVLIGIFGLAIRTLFANLQRSA